MNDKGIVDIVSAFSWPELPPEIPHEPGTILIKCNVCNQHKPLDEFYKNRNKKHRHRHGRQYWCILCGKRYSKTPQAKINNRNSTLMYEYGIDHAEYERMLDAQGGMCAICLTTEPGGQWGVFHVDHDHATGKVRGLLCSECNNGIGKLKDSPKVLRMAAYYIERHAESQTQEDTEQTCMLDLDMWF